MKRMVEIEDDLDEILEAAKNDLDNACKAYLEDYPDEYDLNHWRRHGDEISEIANGVTVSDADGLYYLYGNQFESAYQNAGMSGDDASNHKAIAIMFYIEQALWEHYRALEEKFDDWRDDNPDAPASEFNPKE